MTAPSTAPGVVVDTNIISFIFKGDTRAALYRPHLSGKLLVISFMTVAELDRWALERNWGAARRARWSSSSEISSSTPSTGRFA